MLECLSMQHHLIACVLAALTGCACPVPHAKAVTRTADRDNHPQTSARVILLGTNGGPVLSAFRSEPASLLVVNGTPYLVDAGAGVAARIVSAGYRDSDIQRVFITHNHIDHNAGVASLISLIWFYRAWREVQLPPVQIFGPPATQFLVQTALRYLSVSERIFRAGVPALPPAAPMFQAHDIYHDGVIYQDANVKVTAIRNTHFIFISGSAQTETDTSYSLRFDTARGSVVFTGDTGPSDAVARLARDTDLLVSEVCLCLNGSGDGLEPPLAPGGRPAAPPPGLKAEEVFHSEHEHLTPEELGMLASRAHVKVVLLTHFVPGDIHADVSQFTAGVQKYFHGTVIAGQDLLEYDVPSE